jgi:hypothetical protein
LFDLNLVAFFDVNGDDQAGLNRGDIDRAVRLGETFDVRGASRGGQAGDCQGRAEMDSESNVLFVELQDCSPVSFAITLSRYLSW